MNGKYTGLVGQIQYGSLAEELDEKLTELVKACESCHRQGELTLTLKLKPGKGNSGQMEVTPVVKMKAPEAERGSAILFTTPEGNLQQQDPRQPNLPLKQAAEPAEPVLKIVKA